MFEPGSRSDTIDSPGAVMSMLLAPEAVSVNVDRWSPGADGVEPGATEPTDRTNGSYPGLVRLLLPPLPPATTTTMPFFQAFSTAKVSGSDQAGAAPGVPYDRFSTRIGFFASSLRCWTTQSIAAITWDTSTAPAAVPAFTEVIFALEAMPLKLTELSKPPMMPARCVPWP